MTDYALDFDLEDWRRWFSAHGYPRFGASQVYGWIFQKGVVDPNNFTNLSKPLRNHLAEDFDWSLPEVDSTLVSKDGSRKMLLKTHDGLLIEMVVMDYESRVTLCLSSQVGCRMGCTFCQTGKMGLKRNLTSGEILAQIIIANRVLPQDKRVSNIVFMGMGEPLDNYDHVVKACRTMIDPGGFNLSQSRVTISTSGLVPEIQKLAHDLPVRLAISLHNADDEKRSKLMPVNRRYPLSLLKEVLLEYPAPKRYGITFEYVLIEGVNDSSLDAKKLVRFLHGIKAKVNLIPLNHFPGVQMKASEAQSIRNFQSYLAERSIPAPVRYSRGQDVSGGCGQLAAKRENELNLDPRVLHRMRRKSS